MISKKNFMEELIKKIAEQENIEAGVLEKKIKQGRVVVPLNCSRRNIPFPTAIGEGLTVKVNANIGRSPDISDMDTNNDGVVSFNEYSDFHSEQLRWSFNALDADNDGSISASEWDIFLKMHGVGMKDEYKHQG